ncbi:MAG: hypothetical protein U5N56_06635 [Candidatus Marinimicrobia bacterium]|nr:hypothetical protein [Candidatus Neomarinimicrobiota bacterium]
MKRSRFILLYSLLLAGTFLSCDLFEKEVMSVLVYAEHYYTGRRAPDWETVSVPGVYLHGELSGSRFPEFDTCRSTTRNSPAPTITPIDRVMSIFHLITGSGRVRRIAEPKFGSSRTLR